MWGCANSPYFSWVGGLFPGWIFSMFLWGLIILAVLYLLIKVFGLLKEPARGRQNRDKDDSIEILKVRFAKGEISQDEYLKMKNALLQA
jgi:putative membrane protein